MKICVIGIDVGLTSAKAAAFDERGDEIRTVSAPNPRVAVSRERQEVDMDGLWDVVADVMVDLTADLLRDGWTIGAVGATGHGNGLYLVDEDLRPVRTAIASTDSRAEGVVAGLDADQVERVRRMTGSMPWAAQPGVLLRWLRENEPETIARARWALTCKDWLTVCLTGTPSADLSDSSGCGLVNLETRDYEPAVIEMLGLPADTARLFPPLRRSDEVVGQVTEAASRATGLPVGTPVVAGCMDCVASPLGAGSAGLGDVTVIVGTWAINSVVVPSHIEPPRVTINALLPEPGAMLAMEVAPTSAASIEWASHLLGARSTVPVTPRDLLEAAEDAEPLADGLIFLPFIHGAPEHLGASGTFLGIKDCHRFPHVARAVAEGITQYHRLQLDKVRASGATVSDKPWTLAGGGAKNPIWAQMFADIVGRPMRRQLGTELGARGVALLAARGIGQDVAGWRSDPDPALVVSPGECREAYCAQAQIFDRSIAAMGAVWEACA
ncbi:FGGY-family carbohydrate kinase [Microbacterium sp. UBA3394]|uniref:FGGY-family carbohydrate kinase n=1 Tax=Microbacterium sp. UBA3394 TaxID=1946945 RepID=UPI000C4EDD7E|nr:FGGY-family carbohydrate kinase [Microbacterium sp. UBA3394]MAM55212.1 carbohydrate kinase [Microbacterium sp.]|tara:strand:- start:2539 stop:4029 length:1491 start_codon:yes stop_codon:yes gene_type:complete